MTKISVSLDDKTLDIIDKVADRLFDSKRSQAVRYIIKEYIRKK